MALVPMQSPTISAESGFHLSVRRFSAHPPAPCGRSLLRISDDERPEPQPAFQSPRTPPDKLPANEVPDLKSQVSMPDLCSTSTTLNSGHGLHRSQQHGGHSSVSDVLFESG